MAIPQDSVDRLMFLMDYHYNEWTGFDDPRYIEEEIEYKQSSIEKAKDLLSKEGLAQLIANDQYDEVVDRIDEIGKDNNLLWRGVPRQGDLSILYLEDLDKPAFSQAFYELLYGTGEPAELLQKYADFIEDRGWPNRWTFPTYYRFLLYPETDFFVKPTATRWYLEALGSDVKLGTTPSKDVYKEITNKAHALFKQLSEYGPKNLIDIQSLLWTAYRTNQEVEKELGTPFNALFTGRGEAEWAFDFLQVVANKLGIKSPEDRLASFTLRKKGKENLLRLNFGGWLTVGFAGAEDQPKTITLALNDHPTDVEVLYQESFITKEGEPSVYLFTFNLHDVIDQHDVFQEVLNTSLAQIKSRFSNWKATPFRNVHVDVIAEAVFDPEERDELLTNGIFPMKERFWKIAPGEKAWNWEHCFGGGFITMGWDSLGDLSGVTREEFEERRDEAILQNPSWKKEGLEQLWKFSQIADGDRIVANRGISEVLGLGTVTGNYYFIDGVRHGHRVPVNWDDVGIREVSEPGWRRTLVELEQAKFEEIVGKSVKALKPSKESPFTERTFELLEGIHNDPTSDYYNMHKDEFKFSIETPFRELMRGVAEKLPAPILELMETEKGLFSRFLKNDFGRGGAWDFYWGAFYPAGSKRIEDAQLSLWMNYSRLEAGFFIGEYGSNQRERFVRNCQRHYTSLVSLLRDVLSTEDVSFGPHHFREIDPSDGSEPGEAPKWKEWLEEPDAWEFDVSVVFHRYLLLGLSKDELVERVTRIFSNLFPLVLLAVSDDPLPLISEYLGEEPDPYINPEYSLEQCADETSFELGELKRWVRALERKGQAIFYGPPGTGKTFVAEKLAMHLIGGGDGFVELVQFHPAYAYEDFIQGIRPQPLPDGGLSYPIVPGRFLEFCARARMRSGKCVLIVDEINRANLARVFGELMYLLEYRESRIPMAGGKEFGIPGNVRIIGTMNTADRSIALVDHALRRRFAFLGLYPNYQILEEFHRKKKTGFKLDGLIAKLKELNLQISDHNYYVGITYFLRADLKDQIEDIWRMEIEPYLEEYFFDRQEKVKEFRWENVADKVIGRA